MLTFDPVKDAASGSSRPQPNRKPAAKALIVSIAYQGQQSLYQDETGRVCVWDMSLGGNHEAAQAMRDLLMDNYGYKSDDITLLTDGSNWYAPPTKENIVNGMKRLVADAQDGDRFVFFFSGHGDQMDAQNDPNETDNKDEFIIPIDHDDRTNVIIDDEIKELLVVPIQNKKVNLVGIFDCCHSGTIMDLHENIYNKDDLHFDSPMDSPVSPVREHVQLDFRNRRPIPIGHAPVRRDPLALGQNYAITGDIHSNHQSDEKENEYLRVTSRSLSHPIPAAIKRFANQLLPVRRSTMPLNTEQSIVIHSIEGFSSRGSARSTHPHHSPMQDITNNVKVIYEASVTSWSACADDQQNWENAKGEAMGTPMINYLYDHPHPTYDELLTELAQIMRKNGKERQKAWKDAGFKEKVIFQRPQLGSLCDLDLNTRMTI